MSDFEIRSGLVTSRLRATDGVWTETPDYETFDRSAIQKKVAGVGDAIFAEGYEDRSRVEAALEKTQVFVDKAFDLYEGKIEPPFTADRVFAVPMRTERNDESYASEVLPFVPLLDPVFGVNSDVRQRTLVGLPPLILDTYSKGDERSRRGALVLTPLFSDMRKDIVTDTNDPAQWQELVSTVHKNINETAHFSSRMLGARVMGLGAILPALTNFGSSIEQEDLTTTTGHGGTVYLIVETAKKVINETSIGSNGKIGVIGGAGSIGYSTIDAITNSLQDFEIHTYDTNAERLGGLIAEHPSASRIHSGSGVLDILRKTDVIVTAVTGRVDLDKEDPRFELDLSGKVIIDDSQPGCFDKHQVEARGGKLLWVVGSDGSHDGFMTRDNGYNFGNEAGIYGESAIWGCEAEASVVASSGQYDKAIRERVTPRLVHLIGELCAEEEVSIAPYQSFGQPVQIK